MYSIILSQYLYYFSTNLNLSEYTIVASLPLTVPLFMTYDVEMCKYTNVIPLDYHNRTPRLAMSAYYKISTGEPASEPEYSKSKRNAYCPNVITPVFLLLLCGCSMLYIQL